MASRGSAAWRQLRWGEPCRGEFVTQPIYEGGPNITVRKEAASAFRALGRVFLRNGYVVRRAGAYNCRHIAGSSSWSSHAWGLSVDINDDTNPYRKDRLVTDIPKKVRDEAVAIQTVDGVQVFRWGGDWDGRPDTPNSNYDAMHFEIIATPAELARGIAAMPAAPASPDPDAPSAHVIEYPTVRRGDKNPLVTLLQALLGMERTTGTGTFGPRTEKYVKDFQASRGLRIDGIVGNATWTAILTKQPALGAGDVPPQK